MVEHYEMSLEEELANIRLKQAANTVCWNCGYSLDERRRQGGESGRCPIPREWSKPNARCILNAAQEQPT